MNKTYVEINLDNIGNNARVIKEKYKEYDYHIGVLKSEAYGHGEYIVNELYENGINYFAVSYIYEALEIRKYNKEVPILCLQPVDLNDINSVVENNLTIIVHDINYLNELVKLNIKSKIKVHIKIDSGMNRLGFKDKNEVRKAFDIINKSKFLFLEGIFSHFATIGVFDNKWDYQLNKFKELTSLIDLNEIPIVHLGSSVILLSHPKIDFCNGIRMGILLYGYNVSPISSNNGIKNILRNFRNKYYQKKYHISETFSNVKIDLKPAMKMYTNIIQIKNVKKGEFIGYGASYVADTDMKIAVLPIGYNNGIGRVNNGQYVLINGKKCPMLGVSGMNMFVVKIDSDIKISDKVLVMGDEITIGQFSRFNNNTLSESLLNIGKNNLRVYVKNKNIIYVDKK